MSTKHQPASMFDGRFILAMVLTISIWVGWQTHLAKKYPETYKAKVASKGAEDKGTTDIAKDKNTASATVDSTAGVKATEALTQTTPPAESKLTFEDQNWKFFISSRGMAITNVELKKYKNRVGANYTFAKDDGSSLFGTGLVGRKEQLDFALTRNSENEVVGTASLPNGMRVTKVLHILSDTYQIKTKVRVENIPADFMGLVTHFSEEILPSQKSSFIAPSFDFQELYANHEGKTSRIKLTSEPGQVETFVKAHIAGVGSQYFAAAIVDNSPVMPELRSSVEMESKPLAKGTLSYSMLNREAQFALDYISFVGPKSYYLLKSVDADLADMINFGFFRSFARGILWLMNSIHGAIGNWGLAIIILTILVRIVVLPFNLIGYKQMKAMSVIQPQMKILREKYKNDQQRLNQEMMTLMKEAKANPLGGCLPMFIQIPVFFALYQVIGHSIELYQAPFALWIHDLSLKDPYFVLPVLMGVTMYFQQKITPSTLEPAQQKIMNFLPIFFTFLMISLPSGLTLYIFVSSVFGVLQQLYFMKDKKINAHPVTAKA